ncbi:MAG: hypothetical protein S0880_33305 [Actinomycetota bacterium]|nr:hypothetical protein [Actinomycetota bacterium]
MSIDSDTPLEFDCPRCGSGASERFYGPCSDCRAELRATLGGESQHYAAAAFEPKMNVTPNAVALKDD